MLILINAGLAFGVLGRLRHGVTQARQAVRVLQGRYDREQEKMKALPGLEATFGQLLGEQTVIFTRVGETEEDLEEQIVMEEWVWDSLV